jgi:hypothetical protein
MNTEYSECRAVYERMTFCGAKSLLLEKLWRFTERKQEFLNRNIGVSLSPSFTVSPLGALRWIAPPVWMLAHSMSGLFGVVIFKVNCARIAVFNYGLLLFTCL